MWTDFLSGQSISEYFHALMSFKSLQLMFTLIKPQRQQTESQKTCALGSPLSLICCTTLGTSFPLTETQFHFPQLQNDWTMYITRFFNFRKVYCPANNWRWVGVESLSPKAKNLWKGWQKTPKLFAKSDSGYIFSFGGCPQSLSCRETN